MEHGGGTHLDERMEQHSGAPYMGIGPGIWISWNRKVDQWGMEQPFPEPQEWQNSMALRGVPWVTEVEGTNVPIDGSHEQQLAILEEFK